VNSQFRIAVVLVMLSLAASVGSADEVTLSVTPDSLTIQPGGIDNFTYTITNNTSDFLVAVNANNTLTQFVSFDYSAFLFSILGPGSTPQTGILTVLTADLMAPPGTNNSGNLDVTFDLYNGDPTNPANYVSTVDVLAPYSITVESPSPPATTPEPASFLLYATGLFAVFALRKNSR
jgi:hypothetical protein